MISDIDPGALEQVAGGATSVTWSLHPEGRLKTLHDYGTGQTTHWIHFNDGRIQQKFD